MLTSTSNVLLTGGTGLIGGELMRALLAIPVRRLWAIGRPAAGIPVATRLAHRLGRNGEGLRGFESQLRPVTGEMSEPLLGISSHEAETISREVDIVIHCAAQTSFVRDAECRRTNVLGMQQLIKFSRAAVRKPLIVYVSTATNCGDACDCCLAEEAGGRPEAAHFNEYTRSKAEAEQMLLRSGLLALIVRPSIVLSAGLDDEKFARNVLWCLPVLNLLGGAPINPVSRLDCVSVGFVVESLIKLLRLGHRHYDCYHLSAGTAGAITWSRISEFLDGFYHRAQPLILLPGPKWTRALQGRFVKTRSQRAAIARLRPYLPFMNMNTVFDNRRLASDLASDFPRNPDPFSYLGSLLRQIPLADALAAGRDP